MKKLKFTFLSIILCLISAVAVRAQDLPKHMTEEEKLAWPEFYQNALLNTKIVAPPPGPVRAPGEWEELQAISITWTSYQWHLREIVRHAQTECKVIINCSDSNTVKNYLTSGGVPLTSNLKFNVVPFNSVWIRDYGSYSVYQNDVEDLFLIDWKYNRPSRPDDDVLPLTHASMLGLPIYEMIANPYLIVHTGGNLMFDGFGTAFSSKLVLDENSSLTESQIDNRMSQFFGTNRYIKFTNLPYDGIHHIDMHMKLLDEETILVGKFPDGVSDGPQIEANIQYLLNNFNSVFGTPYKIIRIPMPHSPTNPNNYPPNAYYRTYTNGVFVNKKFIYPTYYEKFDTTAERILKESLPGYNLVGIICQPEPISASGAIHCITNNIFVDSPLLISHQRYSDTIDTAGPYLINSLIKHRTGIASAAVYYTTDTAQGFNSSAMILVDPVNHKWSGNIPLVPGYSTVYYYISATANSQKTQKRPITAPQGFWKFYVDYPAVTPVSEKIFTITLKDPYPNPARAITCIPVEASDEVLCKLELYDINGQQIQIIHSGNLRKGINNFFFNAMDMAAGVYFIRMECKNTIQFKRIVVYGY